MDTPVTRVGAGNALLDEPPRGVVVMTRSSGFLAVASLVALGLVAPAAARADEAGARRFAATLGSVDEAPEPLSALFGGLERLEGLRLSEADATTLRIALVDQPAFTPIVDALREVTVQGGVIRLALARPVMLTLKRGVVLLATDVSFRVRSGAQGALTVDDARGIKVGRSPSLILPLRRLSVGTEDGKRIGHAELAIGFVSKTVTFDAPAAAGAASAVGLVGAIGAPSR
jgi:hypothetical protein